MTPAPEARKTTGRRDNLISLRGNVDRSGAKVTSQIYDMLNHSIIHFELKPYDEISEAKLAEKLGVSRTPIREALARLAANRLVDIMPQRGTMIAPLRSEDLIHSQFLRESLEIGLIRRAIASPDRQGLVERLRAELEVQVAFVNIGDEIRFGESDMALHRMIAESAGLNDIWREIAQAKVHMDRFRQLTLTSVEHLSLILKQHIEIVDAIESADADRAEASMKRHLRRIFGYIDLAYSLYPQYFEKNWSTQSFIGMFDG